jgi:hypothetical protein
MNILCATLGTTFLYGVFAIATMSLSHPGAIMGTAFLTILGGVFCFAAGGEYK